MGTTQSSGNETTVRNDLDPTYYSPVLTPPSDKILDKVAITDEDLLSPNLQENKPLTIASKDEIFISAKSLFKEGNEFLKMSCFHKARKKYFESIELIKMLDAQCEDIPTQETSGGIGEEKELDVPSMTARARWKRAIRKVSKTISQSKKTKIISKYNAAALDFAKERLCDAENILRQGIELREKLLKKIGQDETGTFSGELNEKMNSIQVQESMQEIEAQTPKTVDVNPLIMQEMMGSLAMLGESLDDDKIHHRLSSDGQNLASSIQEHACIDAITSDIINNLAACNEVLGEMKEAEQLYHVSLRLRQILWGPASNKAADAMQNLATLLDSIGQHNQALDLLETALAIQTASSKGFFQDMSPSLTEIAQMQQSLKSTNNTNEGVSPHKYSRRVSSAASALFGRAALVTERVAKAEHASKVSSNAHHQNKNGGEPEYGFSEEKEPDTSHLLQPIYPLITTATAMAAFNAGTALSSASSAGIMMSTGGRGTLQDNIDRRASFWKNLGYGLNTSDNQKEKETKETTLRLGLDVESGGPEICITTNNLAVVCAHQGDFDRAEQLLLLSMKVREKYYGAMHPFTASCRSNLEYVHNKRLALQQHTACSVCVLEVPPQV